MTEPDPRPLAARLRPETLGDFCGQRHLLEPGKPLREAADSGRLHSMILWGPPGVGKTTLAGLLARTSGARFLRISAVLAGVKDIRAAIDTAREERSERQRATVLFVDEVHRFNKAQQDAFLPHVEDGTVLFIGATTENPSFELNNALLSRARVYVLRALEEADLRLLLQRALDRDAELAGLGLRAGPEQLARIAAAADGDARRALSLLELAASLAGQGGEIGDRLLDEVLSGSQRRFDKGGDQFYDQISALHKAIRGSAPDAALYWLTRMIDGGCDPRYLARRLLRMASEDIGLADPRALEHSLAVWQAVERLGSPEGELALAQATLYLACAAKSNAVYRAFEAARDEVAGSPSYEVPLALRNAPTRLTRELGHGSAYRYAHDEPHAYAAGMNYLPKELAGRRYYRPSDRGLEKKIAAKLDWLAGLDRQAAGREADA